LNEIEADEDTSADVNIENTASNDSATRLENSGGGLFGGGTSLYVLMMLVLLCVYRRRVNCAFASSAM